jgi:uncharacterized protein (TIGR02646 family)
MIKLNRIPAPVYLTPQMVSDLVSKYKATEENVWSVAEIKTALLLMSNSKCAYCECKINVESKYMEVEHYRPKKEFPDLVVTWENLLPACKRCNGYKSYANPEVERFIDPSIDEPRTHIRIFNFLLEDKTPEGKNTIDIIYLNDYDKLVSERFQLSMALSKLIDNLFEILEESTLGQAQKARRRSSIKGKALNILRAGLPSEPYSSTLSSFVISSKRFSLIKAKMESFSMWEVEMEALFDQLKAIAL